MSTVTTTTPKLVTRLILVVCVYFWHCHTFHGVVATSKSHNAYHDTKLSRLQAKIQLLETMVKGFHETSERSLQLLNEILKSVASLEDEFSEISNLDSISARAVMDRNGFDGTIESGSRKRGMVLVSLLLQLIGTLCMSYFFFRILKRFRKTHFPNIKKQWNALVETVNFDVAFDYLVDVTQQTNVNEKGAALK